MGFKKTTLNSMQVNSESFDTDNEENHNVM